MASPGDATPLRLLLVGASGAVGRQVLAAALADPRVGQVVAPTRRPQPARPKRVNPGIDFAHLPAEASWGRVDAVICTLGTTIKAAGAQAAFAAVDRDLPIQVARVARQHGATRYALNSSLGASPDGNFYLRTKAQAEAGVRAVGYLGYTIVRPSLIDTGRDEPRPGELLALFFAKFLRPLLPSRYRAVKPERIARALLEGVLEDRPGERIIESEQLQH